MAIQRVRALGGSLTAALGGVGLGSLWPLLGIAANPSLCVGMSPAQSWVGMRLHLVAQSPACPHGTYARGSYFAPIFGFSFAVSLSALLFGLALVTLAIGGGLVVGRALRRVRGWLRRRLLPVLIALGVEPLPVPAVLRPLPVRAGLAHHPQQRRGPPIRSC